MFLGLPPVLLLLGGSCAFVVVVDLVAVGDVGNTRRRYPDIGVLGDACMDAEGIDLFNKPRNHTPCVQGRVTLRLLEVPTEFGARSGGGSTRSVS